MGGVATLQAAVLQASRLNIDFDLRIGILTRFFMVAPLTRNNSDTDWELRININQIVNSIGNKIQDRSQRFTSKDFTDSKIRRFIIDNNFIVHNNILRICRIIAGMLTPHGALHKPN